MRTAIFGLIACALIAAPAAAQENISLQSSVFIEHTSRDADGRNTRQIEPAAQLERGDRVVLLLDWQSGERNNAFMVTTPIPESMRFRGSGHATEAVSVDGGRSWGELGELRIRENGQSRLASASDVTHVRWRISSREAARGSGRIAFSAIVR